MVIQSPKSSSNELPSKERAPEDVRNEKSLDRLIALSDGIFAFAMTLLALDLVTPVIVGQATDATLSSALANEFHSFLGFFVSFWVISMLWFTHHRIFSYIKNFDAGIARLNLVLLFFVVLVPFATRVLNYGFLRIAVDVFALIQIGAFLTTSIIWRYASDPDRHLLYESVPQNVIKWLSGRGFVAATIYVLSMFVGFLDPNVTVVIWLAIFPILIALDRHFTKRTPITEDSKKLRKASG